jgi:hypothetical protein
LLCCVLIALGFARARRTAVALQGAAGENAGTLLGGPDAEPVFAFPWLPIGAAPPLHTQLLTIVVGTAAAYFIAGVGASVLVLVALVLAFRVPRLRAILALAPPILVALIGLYVAFKQSRTPVPPVFEWPILFPRGTAPAWGAVVLFAADALYEMVRRGRRRTDSSEPRTANDAVAPIPRPET